MKFLLLSVLFSTLSFAKCYEILATCSTQQEDEQYYLLKNDKGAIALESVYFYDLDCKDNHHVEFYDLLHKVSDRSFKTKISKLGSEDFDQGTIQYEYRHPVLTQVHIMAQEHADFLGIEEREMKMIYSCK